jgi:hypothetical protein
MQRPDELHCFSFFDIFYLEYFLKIIIVNYLENKGGSDGK